jgi:hypothetical protein
LERNVTDYSLVFPEDFDDYEREVEAKGWFTEARLLLSGRHYRLSFYDPVRLGQEIESELRRGSVFFEPNLIVVEYVSRSNMKNSVEILMRSGAVVSLVAE